MNLLARIARLKAMGILGMNQRNTECILDLNPRARFPLVDGKKRMRDLCLSIGVPTPDVYAVVAAHSALRHLPRLLERRDSFVIKPNRGAGGRGVLVVVGREPPDPTLSPALGGEGRVRGDRPAFVRHNGKRLEMGDVSQHVSSIISGLFSLGGRADEALIQQRVVPDPAFERISFQGTADVRVIVYRDVVIMAMLRLPTRLSGGRANLHQGAIGAGVDLETGRTTRAVLRNRVTERHPDTGASVVGFTVPYWPHILEMAQRVSRAAGLGYVGVDVVVDRNRGPLLLEANARPGLAIQIANGQGLIHRFQEIDRTLDAIGDM